MEAPSIGHRNRQKFNWLIYKTVDNHLKSFIPLIKGHIYDLGCGEMPYRDWFMKYAESYTGIDWSNTLHDLKADIVADLNKNLPIDDQVADVIICLSVMEHLCEPLNMLCEAYRILKDDGVMILQVPFMWWVHEAPYDYFRFTKYGLIYLFQKAGFTDIEVYSQTGFWTMWFLKLNYQSTKLIRGPYILRKIIALVLWIFWEIDQRVAPLIDRLWSCEEETAGYFVVARKKVT